MSNEEYSKGLHTGLVDHGKVGSVEGYLHRMRMLNPGPTAQDSAATARHDEAFGAYLVRFLPAAAFVVGLWILAVDRGIALGAWLGLYEADLVPNWYMAILLGAPIVLAFLLRKIIVIAFWTGLLLGGLWWLVFG
jgi:hypothetical protein